MASGGSFLPGLSAFVVGAAEESGILSSQAVLPGPAGEGESAEGVFSSPQPEPMPEQIGGGSRIEISGGMGDSMPTVSQQISAQPKNKCKFLA